MGAREQHDPVLVIGAGGHAKVVIDSLRASGFTIAGLLDADATPRQVAGAPVIGDDFHLPRLRAEGLSHAVVAMGDNAVRERVGASARAAGFTLVNAVHPAATVSPSASMGEGVAVMAGAVVNAETRVGDLAIVNTGACVDHDGDLLPACHIAPRVALAGNVRVGARALVGVGASVIPGVSIGADAVVGAGAAVIGDVAAGTAVAGVPARLLHRAPPPSLQA